MFPDCRWRVLALAAAALLPYVSSLRHDWVYDDHGVIVENAFLSQPGAWHRLLTLDTLRDGRVVDGQRPLVVMSYLADRTAWGLHPAGFRATNLGLHLAAVLLVYGLFLRVTDRGPAFTAALLFAVHPLAVEPVVSPAFREDSLCLVFGLLFLHAGWSTRDFIMTAAAGTLALAAALFSKESAAVLPLVMAAGWWCMPRLRPPRRAMVLRAGAAVAVVAVLAAVLVAGRSLQATGGPWNGTSFRGMEGIWSAPWLAVTQTVRLLLPYPLSVDYVVAPVAGWRDPRCWLAASAVLGGTLVAWRIAGPTVRLGLAWMLLMYLPVSNLVPLYNPVADRYAYGILPGFTLVLAAGLLARRRRFGIVLVVAAIAWCAITVHRVRDWRSDRTLWTAALAVEPLSARAHTWLGLLAKEEGNREQAWNYFMAAETLNPREPSAAINRAIMLGEAGDLDGAEALLREVLSMRPDHEGARQNLAYCLALKGGEAPSAEPGGSIQH